MRVDGVEVVDRVRVRRPAAAATTHDAAGFGPALGRRSRLDQSDCRADLRAGTNLQEV